MFDPALLQAGTAEKLEGFELERIVDLLIDAILFKEGRLRRCMPLIIVADPGITLPDGDIFGSVDTRAQDGKAADQCGRHRPDLRSGVGLPSKQERMKEALQ